MRRFYVILAFLVLAAGVAAYFYLGPSLLAPSFELTSVRYDVNADGSIDLVRWNISDSLVLWEWDRNGDGRAELVAYDAAATAEGGLTPTGSITAWDWGGDSVIDAGNVAPGVEELLQREEIVAARAAPASGEIALVGADVREFVGRIETAYDEWRLDGLRMPIVGASLPDLSTLLPGAPRAYRNGVHQGFDMNDGHIGVPTGWSGPVVAAKDGTVIRAMLDFVEMTPAAYAQVLAEAQTSGTTPPDLLDKLRGRQIWIDHGHGVVTRYVHLSGIEAGITEGKRVRAGDVVGFVGNSGTEAAVNGTRAGAHLHFELRIDDRYFGEGMSVEQIREAGNRIFKIGAGGS